MKRQTKEQKKADEIAAIRRRLLDIVLGAYGYYDNPDLDEVGISSAIGVEAFGRYIGGIRNAFHQTSAEDQERLGDVWISPSCYEELDDLDTAAEYLWRIGVRA